MEQLTNARPLRVAIIGSGPAGFYAVDSLLKRPELDVTVDIFNRFPTPFGLVRDGVAPDHQSIKAVTRVFEKILAHPRVRFFGNVVYGTDIHHADIKRLYDQVIYAVGAQADRRMGIEGEDLPNSLPATAFVGWYNGRPDYRDLELDLSCERAIVVGNGNVAMDVARMLVMSPDELRKTDVTDHALEQLSQSKIREVVILGRRGALQASFTNPELKELGKMKDIDVVVDPQNIELDPVTIAKFEDNRSALTNLEYLTEYSKRTEFTAPRRIVLRFLASPAEILSDNGRIVGVRIEKNELVEGPAGTVKARGTGEFEIIEAGLVLRSVGYRSVPIADVPFDHGTSTLSNVIGRIVDAETKEPVPGEYVVGWAKRGPSGLIGNNKPDSVATVDAMVEDLPHLEGIADDQRDPALIEALLRERDVDFVTHQDWKVLDQHEVARGKERGCPRVKLTYVHEMMDVIRKGRVS